MQMRSTKTLIAIGLAAAIAGYVISLADWGGDVGQFGWLLLLGGLALLAGIALRRIWSVSGGLDTSRMRRGAQPGEDPREQPETRRA